MLFHNNVKLWVSSCDFWKCHFFLKIPKHENFKNRNVICHLGASGAVSWRAKLCEVSSGFWNFIFLWKSYKNAMCACVNCILCQMTEVYVIKFSPFLYINREYLGRHGQRTRRQARWWIEISTKNLDERAHLTNTGTRVPLLARWPMMDGDFYQESW